MSNRGRRHIRGLCNLVCAVSETAQHLSGTVVYIYIYLMNVVIRIANAGEAVRSRNSTGCKLTSTCTSLLLIWYKIGCK